jgi:hemerythrin-like domain-containing protein
MTTRRDFVALAGAVTAQVALSPAAAALQQKKPTPKAEAGKEEVSPAEDLMREHGVLRRILLIYDDFRQRIASKESVDSDVLARTAGIIRRFVEDYHEKLEEEYVFPRFDKAGKLVELVTTLRQQHEAGRRVTARIQEMATAKASSPALDDALRAFIRMYRPHAAREDTILFPAFHQLLTQREYDQLGDQFEARENELFGKEGFEKMVDEVAGLERRLGLENLAQFTPKG